MAGNCGQTCYKSGNCVTGDFIKENNVQGYNCQEYKSGMLSKSEMGCYVKGDDDLCDRNPCIVNDRLKIMNFKDIPFCPYQNVMNFT